jgi:uncharacterized protein (TIGR02996 family)
MSLDLERLSLLAAVNADPADDTARLVMADWLEEKGDREDDGARAEFIRSQIELARELVPGADAAAHLRSLIAAGYPEDDARLVKWHRWAEMQARERELERLHGRLWRLTICSACLGTGTVRVQQLPEPVYSTRFLSPIASRLPPIDEQDCPTCGGSRELFTRREEVGGWERIEPRAVEFRRGFADSVSCELVEAFGPNGVPTPWALAVVSMSPVSRFVVVNREPDLSIHPDRNFGWQRGSAFRRHWSHRDGDVAFRYAIPDWLFSLLPESETREAEVKYYATRDAANNSLAQTIGRVVKGAAPR